MAYPNAKLLSLTLWFTAIVQCLLGVAFLAAPGQTSQLFGLSAAPAWTHWLFGMMAARFLGFGYGMALAARNPLANLSWIRAMIVIQAIDWIVTLYYLTAGAVTLAQVTTASFLPAIFVVLLLVSYPKPAATRSANS